MDTGYNAPYLFVVTYCCERSDMIYYIRYRLLYRYGKEVLNMEFAISFIVAVAAGVVCHYIIKWLDSDK